MNFLVERPVVAVLVRVSGRLNAAQAFKPERAVQSPDREGGRFVRVSGQLKIAQAFKLG